ncbi:uncharacterized protein LOC116175602 isoform X1 [Photinus pyralis]|uniref:DDE Tnp4 domain-containing protein n=1 Tax=Photinus pyralis TaxID=7054 RepID=A0A1Y1NHN4_PHOPY|nr:uncharacterized protein LOC116175602 isoform X1 [Photinus pyralis]
MNTFNSNTLLSVIGAVVAKQRKSPLFYKNDKNRKKLLYLYVLYIERQQDEKVTRRFWVRDFLKEEQRYLQGASDNLVKEMYSHDPEKFFNFFRMTRETFDELLRLVGPKIEKQNVIRESVHPLIRLQITLRYLASGDSMMSMHYMFRVGKNTVSQIIAETCQVIWDTLKPIVFVEPCAENWKKIAREFEVKWNFKNCIGAIDGKHVVMQALPNSGSTYYNYKGSHSYNLLAIADANYQFVMVDIGGEGRQSDSGIFKCSAMGQGFDQKIFNLPDPDEVPYVLVADEAFPLTECMMRPYPRRGQLDMRKKVFHYRLSRARRVVESSFGLLAGRWRIFRTPIIASSTTIKKIIQSTVCLHNFILMKNEADYNIRVTENTGDIVMGNLCEINSTGSNTYSRNASTIREKFADYFSGLGAVEWQWEKALQNDF